jgi:hypothetical protein
MQFDSWISDNIGFREQMITLYKSINQIEKQGQYTDGQYLMLTGQEGHHYFAGVDGNLIQKFQGKPFLTDEQLFGLANGLNQIKNYLDIINPSCYNIHQEVIPWNIPFPSAARPVERPCG